MKTKKLLSPPDEFMKMSNSSIKNILLNWRDVYSIISNLNRLLIMVTEPVTTGGGGSDMHNNDSSEDEVVYRSRCVKSKK